ncbi:MAG: hypothetical protein ACI8QZ_003799 [Chlamydiales bacterium]|jgi:hypothetical protein
MKYLMAGALALSLTTTGFAYRGACIPDGSCGTFSIDLPDLNSPGFPTSAQWSGELAEILDADGFSGDDSMGYAEIVNGAAVGELCNEDGNIVGPNGNVVEGGLKGGCVEVYVKVPFDYISVIQVCSSIGSSIGGGGVTGTFGSSRCQTVELHSQSSWSSPSHEVCPC